MKKIFDNDKYSNIFFRNKFINSTPFSVIAVCEFFRLLKNTDQERIDDIDYITELFWNETISVKSFFDKYFPFLNNAGGGNNSKLQTAIVLSVINNNSDEINESYNVDEIINKYKQAYDEYENKMEQLKNKMMLKKINKYNVREAKISGKRMRNIEENSRYVMAHSKIPIIFSIKEVEQLNSKRKPEDQLERLECGLLKHHCCFPECPDYLTDFATEYDKKKNTRKGINKHLKINMLLDNYYKGIHQEAKKLCLKHVTKQHFTESM
jgi:hypothetical protein